MKYILAILFFIPASYLFAAVESRSFDANNLRSLVVSNTSGYIRVNTSEDAKAHVKADRLGSKENCRLQIEESGGRLSVIASGVRRFGARQCEVHFEILIPKNMDIDLENGSGSVHVNGIKGDMNVRVGSGDVEIDGEVQNLTARSGSGSLEVKGLQGAATVSSGSGDVVLSYKSPPKNGELDVKTGSGDVEIRFPKGTKIVTDLRTGSGKIFNALGDSVESNFKVSVKTGSGNLSLDIL